MITVLQHNERRESRDEIFIPDDQNGKSRRNSLKLKMIIYERYCCPKRENVRFELTKETERSGVATFSDMHQESRHRT